MRLAADLPELVELAKLQLQRAPESLIVMALREATAQFRAVDAKQFEAFFSQTVAALKAYPSDLVLDACRALVETHRYPTLPTTADVLAPIAKELAKRNLLAKRLGVVKMLAEKQKQERPREPLTAEQQAEFDRVMAGLNMRRVPVEPGERTRQTTEAA